MSKFHGRFKLDNDMVAIVTAKGFDAMRVFAGQRIAKTLAPAAPPNDGRQTPLKGHPVFLAQHATATCCRTCLNHWWRVRKGIALTAEQQRKITNLMMAWIEMQVNGGIESVKKKMSDHGHWDGVGLEAPAAARRHPGMPFQRVKGVSHVSPGRKGEGAGRGLGAFDGTDGTEGTEGTANWRSKAVGPENEAVDLEN